MKILIDLINNPKAGGAHYDWRLTMWTKICYELIRKGHKIWSCNHRLQKSGFSRYSPDRHNIFDYYIALSPYGNENRTKRLKDHQKAKRPVTCYDHGWLPKSLVVDRKKLFGDSYYYDTISDLIKKCPDTQLAEPIRENLLKGNISKRAQDRVDEIPDVKYIFIPGQVLFDASIQYYSNTGLRELITQTLEFAKLHNLHVVYKPHPGLLGSMPHGTKKLNKFQKETKRDYNNFHVANTSIYDLIQRAEFTVCVNSGSIIDNIVTLRPVYCCGKSFFSNSGTVIYNPNVKQGLSTMLDKLYDDDEMKRQQLRMLWWLDKYLIQEKQPIEKQIELLQIHSGVTL